MRQRGAAQSTGQGAYRLAIVAKEKPPGSGLAGLTPEVADEHGQDEHGQDTPPPLRESSPLNERAGTNRNRVRPRGVLCRVAEEAPSRGVHHP